MNDVNISICIPAYKNTGYLKRLLDSIAIQTYKDYEIIVTDDSPDDSVEKFIVGYSSSKSIKYFKNNPSLGTPENWNEGVRHAQGDWIKIMHDDDWFTNEKSLEKFAKLTGLHKNAAFIYCRYINIENDKIQSISAKPSTSHLFLLNSFRETLLSENIIGPPSVTLYKNEEIFYDKNLKWLVDIDFYIRFLKDKELVYCDDTLVCIGLNELQVTKQSSRIKEVEIPEYFYVLNKYGENILNNLFVYDSYWRLARNFKLFNLADITAANYLGSVPKEIMRMMKFQHRIPEESLTIGVISKSCMFLSYIIFMVSKLWNRGKNNDI